MTIRHANNKDIDMLAAIEAVSYPAAEGASRENIAERVHSFAEYFWILEDDGRIKAFINGMVTKEKNLTDEMYSNVEKHDPDGDWQMIFSVVTAPECRGKGYASMLMKQLVEDVRDQKRKGVVLTCKESLLGFYGQFGFRSEGISESTHGDAKWYQMRLSF